MPKKLNDITLDEIQKIVQDSSALKVVHSLIEKGLVSIYENLNDNYKPKQEAFVFLNKNYFKDDSHLGTHHNNRRVNWGSSIKLRNTLLKENKELYNKYTGKGEKYLIYIDSDFSFWSYWRKVQCKIIRECFPEVF